MHNQGQSVYSYPVIGPGTRYNQEILNDFIIIIQIMKLLFATLYHNQREWTEESNFNHIYNTS